jgi:hypothetical protein
MRVLSVFLLMSTGCGPKVILRDAVAYRAELDQHHKWATVQAGHLRTFIEAHCECGPPAEFSDVGCEEAANYVLIIEARAEWHKQMSLWNAGLLSEDQEPLETPPNVSTLECPLPAAPLDEE